ncbi:MAG: hypothetical protein NTV68_03440 [Methanomicrobiales archaeon]|nr:hypothetical protein [Methanomicrobiales archaeon]
MRSGSVPASIVEPTRIVSGRSVFSWRVTQGTPRMQVSSRTPPKWQRKPGIGLKLEEFKEPDRGDTTDAISGNPER